MEISHLLTISLAFFAGAAVIFRVWNSIINRQELFAVNIDTLQRRMDDIPGNDPKIFRSVADCNQQRGNCDAVKNLHLLQQTVAEMAVDNSEGKKRAIDHQRFMENEVRKITTAITRLETQLDERTQKGAN